MRDMIERMLTEGTWQKMLTARDLSKLPPLYSTENDRDPMVWVRFFNPRGSGTWYATEFDGRDTFFGFVMGFGDDELGYFSLDELKQSGIERDQYWKPMKLSLAKAYEKKMSGRED